MTTITDVKEFVAKDGWKQLLVVGLDENNNIAIKFTDMPIPLFCMIKEAISIQVTKSMMPIAAPAKPTLVTPLTQP